MTLSDWIQWSLLVLVMVFCITAIVYLIIDSLKK